jgi:hypothetical protein
MPILKESTGGLNYIHADLEGNIFMPRNSALLVISNMDNGLRYHGTGPCFNILNPLFLRRYSSERGE